MPPTTQAIPEREHGIWLPLLPRVPAVTALLLAQAAAFAVAVASGKIPTAVITLFRALLTL